MPFDPTQAPVYTCQVCRRTCQQGYQHYFDGQQYQTEWLMRTVCDDCEQEALFAQLTSEQRQQVEALLYQRRILEGMRLLRKSLAIGLGGATVLYSWRYRQLRKDYPALFHCSDEDYWQGFYS